MILAIPQILSFLNQVAFRAFHHIAITAKFDALRITEDDDTNINCNSNGDAARNEWDFGESDAPIIVSGELCCHKDLSLQRINTALKVYIVTFLIKKHWSHRSHIVRKRKKFDLLASISHLKFF